jgi:DNA-binding NarL/FixJ family response regulator
VREFGVAKREWNRGQSWGSSAPSCDASLAEGIEPQIRILLVDDHLSFRQPLAFILMREPDITITGQAGSLAEARPLLSEADIALIDLDLPDGEGIDLIEELRSVNPRAMALVLTDHSSDLATARAVEAGAAGVIHKARPISEIMEAIRRLQAGESLLSVRETIEILRFITRQREEQRTVEAKIARLTPREREVLQALAAGLSDDEIAEQLYIRRETVRSHMVHVLHKLEVDSRLKALVFAVKHGLVTIEAGSGRDERSSGRAHRPAKNQGGARRVRPRHAAGHD